MKKSMRKTITLIFLTVMMVLFTGLGLLTSTVASATVFTNNLFVVSSVNLTNNTSVEQGGRSGTLVAPLKDGAYAQIDRKLAGSTNLEFGIVDLAKMGKLVLSFNGENNGFDVEFIKNGDNLYAIVVEAGVEVGGATKEKDPETLSPEEISENFAFEFL